MNNSELRNLIIMRLFRFFYQVKYADFEKIKLFLKEKKFTEKIIIAFINNEYINIGQFG